MNGIGQIDDPNALRPHVPVGILQGRVEPPYGDGHLERRREPVGVDDGLRGHGNDHDLDAVAAETLGFPCNRRDGRVRGDRSRSKRGDLFEGEVPTVAAGHDRRAGRRRLGGQPGAGGAEPLHELGGGGIGACRAGEQDEDENSVDPHADEPGSLASLAPGDSL